MGKLKKPARPGTRKYNKAYDPERQPTVLNYEEEMLVKSLGKLGKRGYRFDRLQLEGRVQDYLRRLDRTNPFENGMPGLDWCLMFESR